MKLKLKEEPREWRNFVLVWCGVALAAAGLLWRKGSLGGPAVLAVAGAAGGAALLACLLPRLFRGAYRAGMTGSFYVGLGMGKVILTLVFWAAVVPMGLLLRLAGKDLLELKPHRGRASYWKEARKTGQFEQQF